ncbi:MAG: hypothetical protein ACTS6G_05940 [Candidatus Hodgkinia cicadicola]
MVASVMAPHWRSITDTFHDGSPKFGRNWASSRSLELWSKCSQSSVGSEVSEWLECNRLFGPEDFRRKAEHLSNRRGWCKGDLDFNRAVAWWFSIEMVRFVIKPPEVPSTTALVSQLSRWK